MKNLTQSFLNNGGSILSSDLITNNSPVTMDLLQNLTNILLSIEFYDIDGNSVTNNISGALIVKGKFGEGRNRLLELVNLSTTDSVIIEGQYTQLTFEVTGLENASAIRVNVVSNCNVLMSGGNNDGDGIQRIISENLIVSGNKTLTAINTYDASPTTAGIVKYDGVTIIKNSSGQLEAIGGGGDKVQSNWTETNIQSPSYIKNKPQSIVESVTLGENVVSGSIKFADNGAVTYNPIDKTFTFQKGGQSDNAKAVVINVGEATEENSLCGATKYGIKPAHGIKNVVKNKPFLDIKKTNKILSTSLVYPDYALNNYCYLENGFLNFAVSKSVLGQAPVLTGSYVSIPSNVTNFDFTSYVVNYNSEIQLLVASYINPTTNCLEIQTVKYDRGNLTVNPVKKTTFVATDNNTKMLVPVHGNTLDVDWAFIFYWTEAGLSATALNMPINKLSGYDYLISAIKDGKGEIVVGSTPNTATTSLSANPISYVTAKVFNRKLVVCYTSRAGIIEAEDKDTNIVEFDVANLIYDVINNALLVTYLVAEDEPKSNLSGQACANLYTLDKNKNLIKLSKLVRLNNWVEAEKVDKRVNLQVLTTGSAGQYIWFLRNPNGTLSMIGFCTAPNNTIYKGTTTFAYTVGAGDNEAVSSTNMGALGLTNNGGFDLALINNFKTGQTYEQWLPPSVTPNNFLGQAINKTGDVTIKGTFKIADIRLLSIGSKYYLQWKPNNINDGSYELVTSSTSGLYIGMAINYNTLVY